MPNQSVLITGGAGNIATHYAAHAHEKQDLTLLDLPGAFHAHHTGIGRTIEADLSMLTDIAPAFAEVDTVLHLGGERRPGASWESLLPNNIIGTFNVLTCAVAAGVRHVVYASSVHTVMGYPPGRQIRENDPPRPSDLYGVTKCFGEAMGAYVASTGALSFTALRIGAFQHESKLSGDGIGWMMQDFTAIDDLVQLIFAAVDAKGAGFRIYNAVSANRFSRLSIERARTELDYQPTHDSFQLVTQFRDAIDAVGGLDPVAYEIGNRAEISRASQALLPPFRALSED